jgi:hypothetical protein
LASTCGRSGMITETVSNLVGQPDVRSLHESTPDPYRDGHDH